jgi:hypothetical protein
MDTRERFFGRGIERGNLVVAEVTVREIGRISLVDALEWTALIALKESRRHGRAGARLDAPLPQRDRGRGPGRRRVRRWLSFSVGRAEA